MTEVLMSATNPNGWKLEDLFAQLRLEIEAKSKKIVDKTETDRIAYIVYNNNMDIIQGLAKLEMIQRDSYFTMNEFRGKNPGPDVSKPAGRFE